MPVFCIPYTSKNSSKGSDTIYVVWLRKIGQIVMDFGLTVLIKSRDNQFLSHGMSVKLQKVITCVILSEKYYINMVQFSIIMEFSLNIGKKIMD